MGNGPFGVDLDAAVEEINHGQAASTAQAAGAQDPDLAPDTSLETDAPEASDTPEAKDPNVATPKTDADDGTELALTPDGKIRLYGKELSPVELSLALEKLEKIEAHEAKMREYAEHFEVDLPVLKRRPELIYSMQQQGYPVEFVRKAIQTLRQEGIEIPPRPAATPAPQAKAANPEPGQQQPKHPFEAFPELKTQWDRMNKFVETQIVHGLSKDVDSVYDKYDAEKKVSDPDLSKRARRDADEALKALSDKGHDILDEEGRLRPDVVRRVYQLAHQKLKTQIDKRVRSVVTAQKKANASVRDNGNGGVVPTRPADKPKTIRDAARQWEREVGG